MAPASLRALLDRAIDYAGLFPPANLSLEPALRNQAEYVGDADAWMLGAFILPVAEFDAAARWMNQFDENRRLRISALGPRSDNSEGFLQSLAAAGDAIDVFRSKFRGAAVIEQLEMPLPPDPTAAVLQSASAGLVGVKSFWEAPAKSAVAAIEVIAQHNQTRPNARLGFKLRTGGVTPDAFPSSEAIAAALHAAGRHGVPIKFTAGLHHPVRLFHDSVQTKMHGFVNVLGAGVLALEHGWPERQIAEVLEDEDAESFVFSDETFSWREWTIATTQVSARRQLVTSFGSCSFDEPREDLRALKLL